MAGGPKPGFEHQKPGFLNANDQAAANFAI